MLVLVDHQKIISTHSSTGAALSDKGLMAAGVTIDFAAVNLGHVALLNLHLLDLRLCHPWKPIEFARSQSFITIHVGLAVDRTVELCLCK